MTLRDLIGAVEAGEFHDRPDGPPRYSAMMDALEQMGFKFWREFVADAMHKGPEATAAILRAMEAEGR